TCTLAQTLPARLLAVTGRLKGSELRAVAVIHRIEDGCDRRTGISQNDEIVHRSRLRSADELVTQLPQEVSGVIALQKTAVVEPRTGQRCTPGKADFGRRLRGRRSPHHTGANRSSEANLLRGRGGVVQRSSARTGESAGRATQRSHQTDADQSVARKP